MKRIAVLVFIAALSLSTVAQARLADGDLLQGVKPGPDDQIDIITVFAHQDDESIYGGGSLFRALEDPRVRLHIMCLTVDRTSEAKDNLGITPEHIGRIRVEELETAAAVYGADVIQLDYHSQTLQSVDPEELIRVIEREIDRVGAEIVITHDPKGITGHPDHMACSRAATEAFNRSEARVLYYPTLPSPLYKIVNMVRPPKEGAEPARPDFRVDIRPYKKMKKLACYSHASQMLFTEVGPLTDLVLILDHEYFTRAASRP